MSQEEHECLNCHEHYAGSYCPRCGQAATTDRFSMKVAAENFADAYGMGERGMFRTMRDLLLRPGYLILDYLRGMRVSYFAPFKMFFLLFAISTLVTHGFNIKGQLIYDDTESVVETQKSDEGITDGESVTTGTDDLETNVKPVNVTDRSRAFLTFHHPHFDPAQADERLQLVAYCFENRCRLCDHVFIDLTFCHRGDVLHSLVREVVWFING